MLITTILGPFLGFTIIHIIMKTYAIYIRNCDIRNGSGPSINPLRCSNNTPLIHGSTRSLSNSFI